MCIRHYYLISQRGGYGGGSLLGRFHRVLLGHTCPDKKEKKKIFAMCGYTLDITKAFRHQDLPWTSWKKLPVCI